MQQVRYAQERDSGYNRNNVVYSFMQGDIQRNYQLIRNELIRQNIATAITRTSQPMTQHWSDTWGFEWPGSTAADSKTDFNYFASDDGFVRTLGLKLKSGRDLDLQNYPTDSNGVLLNEAAVKVMRLKDPIGTVVRLNNDSWHVVGVIKDFILESPYDPVAPMMIVGPKGLGFYVMNMKFNHATSIGENLKKAEPIFKKYNPSYPFEYNFLDQDYAEKFNNEKRTGQLSGLFAGLTIFISCLGLFGLANYMAENRIKEIGIRKVLGASVVNITRLLSMDFLKLVVIAFVLAAPVAWFVMNSWLASYSYRIQIGVELFIITFLISLAIAFLTVGYQSIRAALTNPSKNLRSE
jgi:ABC-type antimicrobial peptide transport system permease subunit